MPKKFYKAEEIINILKPIEILVSLGQTAQMATRGVVIAVIIPYRFFNRCVKRTMQRYLSHHFSIGKADIYFMFYKISVGCSSFLPTRLCLMISK